MRKMKRPVDQTGLTLNHLVAIGTEKMRLPDDGTFFTKEIL